MINRRHEGAIKLNKNSGFSSIRWTWKWINHCQNLIKTEIPFKLMFKSKMLWNKQNIFYLYIIRPIYIGFFLEMFE